MAFQLARRIQIMVLMVPAWPESGFGNEPPGWAMGRQLAGRRDVSWRGDGTSAGGETGRQLAGWTGTSTVGGSRAGSAGWDVNGGRQGVGSAERGICREVGGEIG
jgi:hypothetical protein